MERVIHPIPPICKFDSKVLVLGSFPSVKSREGSFYYHHPQNRFWSVISRIYKEEQPTTIEAKRQLLLKNKIAVWDVIQSCEITGSSDSSIKNVITNDILSLLNRADIRNIYANGGTAYRLYQKYCYESTGRDIIGLPSTSPANAAFSLESLIDHWSCLAEVTR
ncbi:MAG TPA: DNA-deoxyinosine glycosylase [Mobilitalea sp.]|nr:DNA-deoxyinosine glycosylase [Mobilitalea sp.]